MVLRLLVGGCILESEVGKMTVFNVIEKLDQIKKCVDSIETGGVLQDRHFKEIVELLEEYRDSLLVLEINL